MRRTCYLIYRPSFADSRPGTGDCGVPERSGFAHRRSLSLPTPQKSQVVSNDFVVLGGYTLKGHLEIGLDTCSRLKDQLCWVVSSREGMVNLKDFAHTLHTAWLSFSSSCHADHYIGLSQPATEAKGASLALMVGAGHQSLGHLMGPLVASLLLVAMRGAPSSFLFLVVRPGAPSSFLS